MRRFPPRGCAIRTAIGMAMAAAAAFGIEIGIGTAATAGREIATATTAPRARSPLLKRPRRRRCNGNGVFTHADPSTVLPPAQDLPVLGRQCPEDRLQGREAVAALRLRARQDRAELHHRSFGQEAA